MPAPWDSSLTREIVLLKPSGAHGDSSPDCWFTCCGPIASLFLGILRNLSRDEDIPGRGGEGEMFISVLTLLLLWTVHELSHSLF